MRPPSFPTILRTFSVANFTRQIPFLQSPSTSIATFSRTIINHNHSFNYSTTFSSKRISSKYHFLLSSSMPTIPFLSALFSTSSSSSSSKDTSKMTDYPIQKSDSEWQAVLSPEQFRVIRGKGTEAPYAGKYDKHMPSEGVYTCAACSTPLYTATHKFKSGCGWPAYFDSIPGAVERHTDRTLGMDRTEITCAKCGGHLGHVFKGEGYPTPTDERHCVNSVSLNFKEEGGKA